MNKLFLAGLLFTSLVSTEALAAKHLKAQESIEIDAKASDVWTKVSNYGDLGAWHPAVKSTEISAGNNNEKDAVRVLTLQDGGTIREKLEFHSAARKRYSYTILEGVLPVSDYHSTISVKALPGDKSRVTWRSKFKSAGASDEEALSTISAVYRGGLDNLKKISEAR